MTFSRTLKTPVSFLAYNNTPGALTGEGLHVQIGVNSATLPVEDAQALADYINEKFPRETSD